MKAIEAISFLTSALIFCISGSGCQHIPRKRSEEMIIPSSSKFLPPSLSSDANILSGIQGGNGRMSSSDHALGNVLDAFKTLENTIIRTKESRASGAKYLNESSLGSRESCMKWCRDYRNVVQDGRSGTCNVAVFEETGKKSCYLFDCGPPGTGFKCQFTPHTSYTSSLLNRATIDLNEWRDQSDHENELLRLRDVPSSSQSLSSSGPMTGSIEVGKKNSEDPLSELQPSRKKTDCQHFQFSCKNSSDCIAIYNVCDGIVQCPDGSDEALERCNRATQPSPPLTAQQTESPIFFDQNLLDEDEAERMRKQLLESSHATLESSNFFHYPKAAAANKEGAGMRLPFFQRPYSVITNDKKIMLQQQLSPAQQSPSLLQQPQENKFYPNYPFYSPVEYFSPGDVLRSSGSAGYNSQQQQQQQGDNDYAKESGGAAAAPLFWSVLSDTQKAGPEPSQVIVAPPVSPYHMRGAVDPRMRPSGDEISVWNPVAPYFDPNRLIPHRNQFPGSRILNQDVTTSATRPVDAATKPPPHLKLQPESHTGKTNSAAGRVRSQSIVSHRESHDIPIAISHLRDSDQSGRDTNSAVIALTLGLSITAMLIGIVGCRMKSIRKRIARRGGRSLAHDADYLVNGMYL